MARSRSRGRSVLSLNPSRPATQRPTGQPAQASAVASRPNVQGDLADALAPQSSVMGGGPLSTLNPNIQAFAPEGGPAAFGGPGAVGGGPEGTALIDMLSAQPDVQGGQMPEPTAGGPPVYQPGFEGQGDYEIPYSEGPTNGDPGGPLNPTPEAPGYGDPYEDPYQQQLLKTLLYGHGSY